jgi:hypothetical protein
MWPRALNLDFSAMSRFPLQRGHFGRRRLSVAKALDPSRHADWTIIFDLLDVPSPNPAVVNVNVVYGVTATIA